MPYDGQLGTAKDGTPVVWVASLGRAVPAPQAKGLGVTPGGASNAAPADIKTDLGQINDAKADARTKLNNATDMERFLALNQKQATGPGMAFPVLPLPKFIGETVRAGDVVGGFSPAYQGMEALTAKLTPKQREPGSGATSDFDAKMFRLGLPSVDKFAGANQRIYEAAKTDSTKANARSSFLDKWYQKTGTLAGGEAAFNKFWLDYSGGGAAAPAGAPADPLGIRRR